MFEVALESIGHSVMISWSKYNYIKAQCCILCYLSYLKKLGRCLEELLYTDDLPLVSKKLEGLEGRLEGWKRTLESKGLRVNVKKTKMIISSENVG